MKRRPVRTYEHPEGIARLWLMERDDGRFEYGGEALVTEDGETYWLPGDHSGVFASADEAERNAFDEVPWMRRLEREGAAPKVSREA